MTTLTALAAQPRAYAHAEMLDSVGRRALEAGLRHGELVRMARGVYAGARHEGSPWVLASAVAIEAHGAITGRGALAAWGAVLDAPPQLMVVMPAQRHLRRDFPDVRLLRTRHQFPISSARGMRVTEPEWALLHAMREGSERDCLAIALEALASGVVSPWALAEMVRVMKRAARRAVLIEALHSYDDGARSILEHTALRDVLVGPRFEALKWQWPVRAQGRSYFLDAFDVESAVAFEFDGVRFHVSPERWVADRERDMVLAARGIQSLRFTHRDLNQRPEWCRAMATAVMDGRVSGVWRSQSAA